MHPNDVIRPVLLPHIRFYRDMMLAKEKKTSNSPMACTKYGLKSEQVRVGHIEAQCACPAAATKSQGAHACYSSYVPLYNSFFADTLFHGEQCTIC